MKIRRESVKEERQKEDVRSKEETEMREQGNKGGHRKKELGDKKG